MTKISTDKRNVALSLMTRWGMFRLSRGGGVAWTHYNYTVVANYIPETTRFTQFYYNFVNLYYTYTHLLPRVRAP